MATIILNNITPTLNPGEKWVVKYTKRGSTTGYINAGSYTTLPIVINTTDPEGTEYEGVIQIDCGNGLFSDPFPFSQIPNPVSDCSVVTNIVATMGDAQATLSWDAVAGMSGYFVKWKPSSSPDIDFSWQEQYTKQTNIVIQNLLNGTAYDFQIVSECSKAITTGTPIAGPVVCAPITNLYFSDGFYYNTTTYYANLSWQGSKAGAPGVTNFTVSYKKSSDTDWIVAGTVTTDSSGNYNYNFAGLNLIYNESYDFKVENTCDGEALEAQITEITSAPCFNRIVSTFQNTTTTSMELAITPESTDTSYDISISTGGVFVKSILGTVKTDPKTIILIDGLVTDTVYDVSITKHCVQNQSITLTSSVSNKTN